jgi:hypothetical protein
MTQHATTPTAVQAVGVDNSQSGGRPTDYQYSRNGSEVQGGDLAFAAPDIELAVLQALLLDEDAWDKVKGWLLPEHFQIIRWRWVYETIGNLRDAGQPADLVTIPDELERRGFFRPGRLEREDVLDLITADGVFWNVEDYARRLVDRSVKQKTARLIQNSMADLSRNGDGLAVLERIAAGIEAVRDTHVTAADFDAEPTADGTLLDRLIVPLPDLAGLGLVGEIADLIHDQTQSARSYCLLTALATVAVATRRTARLRMAFGDVYPNLYAALLGPSSVHHKSTVMGQGRDLLYRAQLNDLIVAANPTSEGLLNRLADKPSGVIFRDEIGTLFGSHQVKYLAMLKQDLMALYDCRPYGRELARGEVRVDAPFLTILGTTTPRKFFDTVSHSDWEDGFLVRWLIVLPDSPPDLDAVPGLLDKDLDSRHWNLAMRLGTLSRRNASDMAMDSGAFDVWDTWRRRRKRKAYEAGDDLAMTLCERNATYALKIAILLAVGGESTTISVGNTQTAITLAEHFETCLLTLREARQDYGVSGSKMQRVFAVIRDNGPDVTTANVYRFAHLPKAEAEPVLDKLLEIGAVVEKRQAKIKGKTYTATTDRLPVRVW